MPFHNGYDVFSARIAHIFLFPPLSLLLNTKQAGQLTDWFSTEVLCMIDILRKHQISIVTTHSRRLCSGQIISCLVSVERKLVETVLTSAVSHCHVFYELFFFHMDTQNKSNGIGKRSMLALSFTAKKCIPAKLLRASNNVLNCHRDFRADVFKPLILSNAGPTANIIDSPRQANRHRKTNSCCHVANIHGEKAQTHSCIT